MEEWREEDKKALMDIGSVPQEREAKCDWCGRITNYPERKNGKDICSACRTRYFEDEYRGPFGSYRRGD